MEIMLMTSSSLPRQHVMELPSLPYYSVTQRNFLQPFSAIFQQIFVEDLMIYLHTAEFGARAKFYTIKGLSAVIQTICSFQFKQYALFNSNYMLFSIQTICSFQFKQYALFNSNNMLASIFRSSGKYRSVEMRLYACFEGFWVENFN